MLFGATLIAGIYGMNFEHMPELGWAYGYPFAVLEGDARHGGHGLHLLPPPRLVVTRSITSANAEYQVLEALRTNRQKRNRENVFIVEGVRNIDVAFADGWTVRSALVVGGSKRSQWCDDVTSRLSMTSSNCRQISF